MVRQNTRNMLIILLIVCFAIYIALLYAREGFAGAFSYEIPRITWSYWEGEPMPEIVKLAHERRQNKLTGWEVRLLSPDSIAQYIDMSTIPANYQDLSPQHKADWIRVALLKRYGGVWLDSTIIINDGDALNRLIKDSKKVRSEFTGFTTFTEPGDHSYIENWFMMAPKNSEFISALYDEYVKAINMGFTTYKKKLSKETDLNIISRIYDYSNDFVYLTQHACIQAVMQKRLGRTPRMLLNRAEESMYKIQHDCKWDTSCLVNSINKPETYTIPYLKLSSSIRDFDINRYFNEGFISYITHKINWAN
jgi:hypothetical protein